MPRSAFVLVTVTLLSGCGQKSKPDADLAALRTLFRCADLERKPNDVERCRILEDFADAKVFADWPKAGMETWIGRRFCSISKTAETLRTPAALLVKSGKPEESIVQINRFEGFALLPYIVQDRVSLDPDLFDTAKGGPTTDAAAIRNAREVEPHWFPIGPAGDSVATSTGHIRTKDGRLVMTTTFGSDGGCTTELWKVP